MKKLIRKNLNPTDGALDYDAILAKTKAERNQYNTARQDNVVTPNLEDKVQIDVDNRNAQTRMDLWVSDKMKSAGVSKDRATELYYASHSGDSTRPKTTAETVGEGLKDIADYTGMVVSTASPQIGSLYWTGTGAYEGAKGNYGSGAFRAVTGATPWLGRVGSVMNYGLAGTGAGLALYDMDQHGANMGNIAATTLGLMPFAFKANQVYDQTKSFLKDNPFLGFTNKGEFNHRYHFRGTPSMFLGKNSTFTNPVMSPSYESTVYLGNESLPFVTKILRRSFAGRYKNDGYMPFEQLKKEHLIRNEAEMNPLTYKGWTFNLGNFRMEPVVTQPKIKIADEMSIEEKDLLEEFAEKLIAKYKSEHPGKTLMDTHSGNVGRTLDTDQPVLNDVVVVDEATMGPTTTGEYLPLEKGIESVRSMLNNAALEFNRTKNKINHNFYLAKRNFKDAYNKARYGISIEPVKPRVVHTTDGGIRLHRTYSYIPKELSPLPKALSLPSLPTHISMPSFFGNPMESAESISHITVK